MIEKQLHIDYKQIENNAELSVLWNILKLHFSDKMNFKVSESGIEN